MKKITHQHLIQQAKKFAPLPTAVVHPVTADAVAGAVDAAKAKLIVPIFIGPTHKIQRAAKQAGITIDHYEHIATEHSHAAAEQAVQLARHGKVNMLMKGSLHTDEIMHPILDKTQGLRTARRMSHVFTMETKTYPKMLLLTDGALNVLPDVMTKKDIIQNAIDLAHAIGVAEPKVAILSAIETVNDKIPSTLDAAVLSKMAERGQIIGGLVDGPLAFDNAVSLRAAKVKKINSRVAGDADILMVPDLEVGNTLAKQLEYLADAKLAGIVLGARLPIVLTSRADEASTRMASCALGALYYQFLQQKAV